MRRRRPEKRTILPDPLYGDLIVAKFINNLMKDGKKSIAQRIVYKTMANLEEKTKITHAGYLHLQNLTIFLKLYY